MPVVKAIEDFELGEIEFGQYDVSFQESSPFIEVLEKALERCARNRYPPTTAYRIQ